MIPRFAVKSEYRALRYATLLLVLFGLLLSGGCSSWGKKDEEDTELVSAEALYGQAKQALLDKKWDQALTALKRLEARYPYGRFAKQAQLDTAYAEYKAGHDGLAIAAADRFINLNPTHPRVDYAYYIKGLASFKEKEGLMGALTGRGSLADRDPESITNALEAFNTIVKRYPNSAYQSDAKQRISYLEAALAEQQVKVARFYYQRGAYIAAVNRSKNVLRQYSDSAQVEDALGIMYQSYGQMRMTDLATDTRRVIELNYPTSRYLKARVKPEGSWLSRLF